MGSHRVGHDWNNLAAAAVTVHLDKYQGAQFLDYMVKVSLVL